MHLSLCMEEPDTVLQAIRCESTVICWKTKMCGRILEATRGSTSRRHWHPRISWLGFSYVPVWWKFPRFYEDWRRPECKCPFYFEWEVTQVVFVPLHLMSYTNWRRVYVYISTWTARLTSCGTVAQLRLLFLLHVFCTIWLFKPGVVFSGVRFGHTGTVLSALS